MATRTGPAQRLIGPVAAADAAPLVPARFMPKNADWDTLDLEIKLGAGVTDCKLTPIFVRNEDSLIGSPDQFQETAQQIAFTAAGSYFASVFARPGYRAGIYITSLAGGSITFVNGRYSKEQSV